MDTTDLVLVVDDDADCRDAIADALRTEGYAVVEARNGREAFDYLLASQVQPFALVLDLDMPIMTGWELLALLANYQRFARIPVVVVSGQDIIGRALRYPSVAKHVMKPCDPYDLARVLELVGVAYGSGTWRTPA